MSVKKPILYFLSIVYAVILLHNITPHVHGSADIKSVGFLSEWFQLLFGKEHQQSQDNHHLNNFSVQDDDQIDITIDYDISDAYFVLPVLSLIFFRNQNSADNEFIYLSLPDIFWKSSEQHNFSGRAPPLTAKNILKNHWF